MQDPPAPPLTYERAQSLAAPSVLRGLGFAALGIGMVVAGMAFDPAAAFRTGAILALGLAVAMALKAELYPRKRRITESEVWIMIPPEERPSKDRARRLIVPAMQRELRAKAVWAAQAALVFLALSGLALIVGPDVARP